MDYKIYYCSLLLLSIYFTEVQAACEFFPEKVWYPVTYHNISELGVAVHEDRPHRSRKLVQGGCDVNYNKVAIHYHVPEHEIDNWYRMVSVLHIAAIEGSLKALNVLLNSRGVEVNVQDGNGATPVYYAASHGRTKFIKVLHDKGGNVSISNINNISPLHVATLYGYYFKVELLIELGAELDVVSSDHHMTPLHHAVLYQYSDIVELLIENAADLNIEDGDGYTALDYAYFMDYKNLIRLLEKSGARHGTVDCDDLYNINATWHHIVYYNVSKLGVAVYWDEPNEVKKLVESGCDVNYNKITEYFYYLDKMNNKVEIWTEMISILHLAVLYERSEVVTVLLNSTGVMVNIQEGNGLTPLFYAARWGYTDLVEQLHESGGELNLSDEDGFTPIHVATINGHYFTVELLIDLGADMNTAESQYGWTPLHYAVYLDLKDVVELLIEGRADLNIMDSEGNTPLDIAYSSHHIDMVKILKKSGAEEGTGSMDYELSGSGDDYY